MLQEEKVLWTRMPVSGMHKLTCTVAQLNNDDLHNSSTGSESDTSSDSTASDDILTEEIITDDFYFEISDPT